MPENSYTLAFAGVFRYPRVIVNLAHHAPPCHPARIRAGFRRRPWRRGYRNSSRPETQTLIEKWRKENVATPAPPPKPRRANVRFPLSGASGSSGGGTSRKVNLRLPRRRYRAVLGAGVVGRARVIALIQRCRYRPRRPSSSRASLCLPPSRRRFPPCRWRTSLCLATLRHGGRQRH